jgi:C6 transcription factor Pro1
MPLLEVIGQNEIPYPLGGSWPLADASHIWIPRVMYTRSIPLATFFAADPEMDVSFNNTSPEMKPVCTPAEPVTKLGSLSSEPKRGTGCWTCKVRHKKCDASIPACRNCRSLEITCYCSSDRPTWMDNGTLQHEMAQRIKSDVKRNAKRRRGRRHLQSFEQQVNDDSDVVDRPSPAPHPYPCSHLDSRASSPAPANIKTPTLRTESPAVGSSLLGRSTDQIDGPTRSSKSVLRRQPQEAWNDLDPAGDYISSPPNQQELCWIMMYLDYVFPTVFPFYKPHPLEGSRNWLLVRFLNDKCLSQIVINVATYFCTVVPIDSNEDYLSCTKKAWEELQTRTDLALQIVQRHVLDVVGRGWATNLADSTYLFLSIVQLLNFETVFSRTGDWNIHLDAALGLFEQIMHRHGAGKSSDISSILDQLGSQSKFPLWSPDQAGFRFCVALLLFHDIIASTSLEQPPRLHCYHNMLPVGGLEVNCEEKYHLRLEEFIGCQNWPLLLIGRVAALDAWKKDLLKLGLLMQSELAQRCLQIERMLCEGLARLEALSETQELNPSPSWPLAECSVNDHRAKATGTTILITRIWAYAARTYLLTVQWGWQPDHTDIRKSVERIIELLEELNSSIWLCALAWPFCIAGCLADERQERRFRIMISSLSGLQNFGTIRHAWSIVQETWRNRHLTNGSWDLALCLRSLGYRALLV